MQTNLVDTEYMQYVETGFDRGMGILEALEAQDRLNAPLPEDLEHPEKLKAETEAGIDEFVRCLGADLAFRASLEPGQVSCRELPLLLDLGEAAVRLAGLFQRMLLAGLDTDELFDRYHQRVQDIEEISLALEGALAGMD